MKGIPNDGEYVVRAYSTFWNSWFIHEIGTDREEAIKTYNHFKNGAENCNGKEYPYTNVELFKLVAQKEVV